MVTNKHHSRDIINYVKDYRDNLELDTYKKPNYPFYFVKKENNMKLIRRFAKLLQHKTFREIQAYNFDSMDKYLRGEYDERSNCSRKKTIRSSTERLQKSSKVLAG